MCQSERVPYSSAPHPTLVPHTCAPHLWVNKTPAFVPLPPPPPRVSDCARFVLLDITLLSFPRLGRRSSVVGVPLESPKGDLLISRLDRPSAVPVLLVPLATSVTQSLPLPTTPRPSRLSEKSYRDGKVRGKVCLGSHNTTTTTTKKKREELHWPFYSNASPGGGWPSWKVEIEMRNTEMLWEGCGTSRFPFSGPPTIPTFPKVKFFSGSHGIDRTGTPLEKREGGERRCGARRGRQAGRPFFIEGRSLSTEASGTRRSNATSGFA